MNSAELQISGNNVYPNLQICLIGEETKMQYFCITKDFWSASVIKPTTEEAIETISVAMKSFDQEVQKTTLAS